MTKFTWKRQEEPSVLPEEPATHPRHVLISLPPNSDGKKEGSAASKRIQASMVHSDAKYGDGLSTTLPVCKMVCFKVIRAYMV